MALLLSIEGNIGSGKSTLVEHLRKKFVNNKDVCFLDEPVSEWEKIKDENGSTVLEKYYKDQSKYAFAFQTMAYISRLVPLRNALKQNYKVIITERCVYTDKHVFAKMLYDECKMEHIEHQIYNSWFKEFVHEIPHPNIVYVKTDPITAKERVEKRARNGENIPLEYLKNCHSYHENWMNTLPTNQILVIDGNIDANENTQQPQLWVNAVENFIQNI